MKIRSLRESDIEAILSLWNRQVAFDKLTPELLEEKVWDDTDYLSELAPVVEHRGQIIAFALAVIRPVQEVPLGYIKMFVVENRFQHYGVAGRLLSELEKRLGEREAAAIRIAESAPNYLMPGLDPRYTQAMVFFEKNGYRRFDETWLLEADLTKREFQTKDAEASLAEEEIAIRRGTAADEKKLADFLQNSNSFAIYPELKKALLQNPASIYFAHDDKNIMALAAHNTNNYKTGWFGPMVIKDDYRDRNITPVLLFRCLRDIKERGHRLAMIPWVDDIAFYLEHCGARVSRVFYRYEKKVVSK
ncbi:MAG: GNAT family N-acetyltransferase [Calditrichaeota bacterium]|nr:MAG: GNAT family N-acetyltransferase [Calditrichota bacterium]